MVSRRLPKAVRFLLLQINGLFPFLYSARSVFAHGNVFRAPARYIADYRRFKAMPGDPQFPLSALNTFPCIYDRYAESGEMPLHYFHQDLWAARAVRSSGVAVHHDFGSRVDGFIAHCLTFCNVVMFDIRDLSSTVEGLSFIQGDVTSLQSVPSNSIASLSSLHAIEHIGLGRYGDALDPRGYIKAIRELQRVAAPGAALYIAVPIGRQRLEFNGQRVFDPVYFRSCFDECDLLEFSAVDDENRFVKDASIEAFRESEYSCGLFRLVKRKEG